MQAESAARGLAENGMTKLRFLLDRGVDLLLSFFLFPPGIFCDRNSPLVFVHSLVHDDAIHGRECYRITVRGL